MADGTFTADALSKLQMRMADMMAVPGSVNRLYAGYDPVTAKALRENAQQRNIEVRTKGAGGIDKRRTVTVAWIEQDTVTVNNGATVACNPTGEEAGSFAQDYTLDAGLNGTVMYDERDSLSNVTSLEDARAQQLLQLDYALSVELNTRAIAFLDANIGTSNYAPTFATLNDATGITIPIANYLVDLSSHFQLSNIMNNLNGGLTIAGPKFWLLWDQAMKTVLNADGKEGKARIDDIFGLYFDIKGLAADTELPIYQVSPFSYAIVDWNEAPTTGVRELSSDRVLYKVPSQFLPGVMWDIVERKTCVNEKYDAYKWTASLESKIFLNPKSVNDANNSGIVKWLIDPTP
jgi:hypothetical protein